MHYSENFDRDFKFYFANRHKFSFSGGEKVRFPFSKTGKSAKEAFLRFDSEGKILPTRHPRLVAQLIGCKKSINMHLKMWADGYSDCLISTEEYLASFMQPVPKWIRESLCNQRKNEIVPFIVSSNREAPWDSWIAVPPKSSLLPKTVFEWLAILLNKTPFAWRQLGRGWRWQYKAGHLTAYNAIDGSEHQY